MNINTNFQLYKLEYYGDDPLAYSMAGGPSATINTLVAACDGMDMADGGRLQRGGLRAEPEAGDLLAGHLGQRRYTASDFVFLYKITTNSPFLWMTMTEISNANQDACTYLPSTSFTYRGFMHYTVCRVSEGELTTRGLGDRLVIHQYEHGYGQHVPVLSADQCAYFQVELGRSLGWDYVKSGSA